MLYRINTVAIIQILLVDNLLNIVFNFVSSRLIENNKLSILLYSDVNKRHLLVYIFQY